MSEKSLAHEIQQEWATIKAKNEEMLAQLPNTKELSEYKELWNKGNERLDAIEAKFGRLQRSSIVKPGELPDSGKALKKSFEGFMRGEHGQQIHFDETAAAKSGDRVYAVPRLTMKDGKPVMQVEFKALSVNNDPAGGYLVSPTMAQTVITKVFETSPIRQYAGQVTISSDAYEERVDNEEVGVGWVGETATRSETTTPEFDMLRIPVDEIYAKPRATQKLLDDAFLDVEAWLAGKVSDKFSREEATQFVSGDGIKKPRGFLTYASGTTWKTVEQIVSGAAAAVTADGIMNLVAALKDAYLSNARFFMKRQTVWAIRKLRADAVSAADGAGGYLWQPTLQQGTTGTLLGYPVTVAQDMPAIAANALAIAFGDLRQAYLIVDRVGLRTLRDPYTTKGYVEFYTTKRVGGGLRQGEALKIQKIASS